MRSIIVLFSVLLATPSFADTLKGVISGLRKFESKTGTGLYTKNRKTVYSKKNCYIAVNSIDSSFGSEDAVTAENFEITVGSKTLGTDLENWDFNSSKAPTPTGFKTYSREFYLAKNRCNYTQQITFSNAVKNGSVLFVETKRCKRDLKTSESLVCGF